MTQEQTDMHGEYAREAEEKLFARLERSSSTGRVRPVAFLLGSPRTGSTFLYQLMIRAFGLPYLSNLANDCFPERPLLAGALQKQAGVHSAAGFRSSYGKTKGAFNPSEGSAVMQHWCGGGHPSQVKSTAVLPERVQHFRRTVAGYESMFGRPLVVKNAWNCFRVASLAETFPDALFVWIRRDVFRSAASDLTARYRFHGDPTVWNSATPANVAELQKLHHSAQVIENQYEFSRAVSTALKTYAADRSVEVWYETLVRDVRASLEAIEKSAGGLLSAVDADGIEEGVFQESTIRLPPDDERRMRTYLEEHAERLGPLRRD